MLVAAITISAKYAPLVLLILFGLPAAFVLWMFVRQIRRFSERGRQFDDTFKQLLPWKSAAWADLSWDGSYSRSAGPFGTHLRFVLQSRSAIREHERRGATNLDFHPPGLASFELRTRSFIAPLTTYSRRATLRTSAHTVDLTIRFGFPGLALDEAVAALDGRPLGRFQVTTGAVRLHDLNGAVIGEWKTGKRLLGLMSAAEAAPHSPLHVGDRHLGDVLACDIATWGNVVRNTSATFLNDVAPDLSDAEQHWLLATLALSAYCAGISRGFKPDHH